MLTETKVLTLHSNNQRRKSEQTTKSFAIRESNANITSANRTGRLTEKKKPKSFCDILFAVVSKGPLGPAVNVY